MTSHASSRGARAPRPRDETTPREGRQRTPRQRMTDRESFDQDLAELEALLSGGLQPAESPSIASNDDGGELSAQSPEDSAPVRHKPSARPRPPSRSADQPKRARRMPPRAENRNDEFPVEREPGAPMRAFEAQPFQDDEPAFAPGHPRDLDQYAERHEPPVRQRRRAPQRLRVDDRAPPQVPPYVRPEAKQHALVTRALRIGATVFSLVALIGVSALLVILIVGGGERSATKQAGVAATSATPPAAERTDAPVVTGSTDVRPDASRASADAPPAPRGIVRAMDAQETATRMPREPDRVPDGGATAATAALAAASAFQPASQSPLAAARPAEASPFSPPPAFERSADEPLAEPRAIATAPAARGAAPAARASTEPAEVTRSVPVTAHVNMRASADNNAAVVAVVPEGKNVDVVECKGWCEVVYNDQRGFVHKRFLKE